MSDVIGLYQQRLKLQQAVFTRIAHVDAIVAIVYRVMTSSGIPLVLKICVRPEDYQHEVHFLNHFAGKLPVPGILDVVEPEKGIHGAILMECLAGSHPEKTELSKQAAYDSRCWH